MTLSTYAALFELVLNWNDLSIPLLVEDGGSFHGDLSFTQNNANMLELYKRFLGSAAVDIQVMSDNSPTSTGLHHHGKLGFKLRIRTSNSFYNTGSSILSVYRVSSVTSS